ncbi:MULTISPECIES: mannosyl-3-phosphoglycerate phosphatase [unclassified Ruegeria]|uniref:HAD-IIB family hydrolase n=1 Tax=unclassified Ruegeria TaxID=2625375 RepID=UPI00148A0257|nr:MULTISPECIES: HAD-IIB family hydrolase [unclassified Ruegeria]
MTEDLGLMIFTDLDGTLIDHETYRWDAAKPALKALQSLPTAVILASSKTALEISGLRTNLGFEKWPAIVENGAGILPPFADDIPDRTHYDRLRAALDAMPKGLRQPFRGFGDVSAAGVVEMTGLSPDAATLAQQRGFSEPGLWQGSDAQKTDFLAALQSQGITAQQGGRFLTLSFGRNKADCMTEIIAQHHPRHTIALGDAPNDVLMLEHAEFGVVVANPHRPALGPLKGEDSGRILRTELAGPAGWNRAVLDFLNRLDLQGNTKE